MGKLTMIKMAVWMLLKIEMMTVMVFGMKLMDAHMTLITQ